MRYKQNSIWIHFDKKFKFQGKDTAKDFGAGFVVENCGTNEIHWEK